MTLKLANESSGFDFVQRSWARLEADQFDAASEYAVRTVTIVPDEYQSSEPPASEEEAEQPKKDEKFFSIDNEAFEVRPVKVTLLPKRVSLYVQ